MNRIDKLNEIQVRAIEALETNEFKGTLMLAPGMGKKIFICRI
jgi:superfamily II DNA or RNA helicase